MYGGSRLGSDGIEFAAPTAAEDLRPRPRPRRLACIEPHVLPNNFAATRSDDIFAKIHGHDPLHQPHTDRVACMKEASASPVATAAAFKSALRH